MKTFAHCFGAGVVATVLALVVVSVGAELFGAVWVDVGYSYLGESRCLLGLGSLYGCPLTGELGSVVASALLLGSCWIGARRGVRPVWVAIAASESCRLLPATVWLWAALARTWDDFANPEELPFSAIGLVTPLTLAAMVTAVVLIAKLRRQRVTAAAGLVLGTAAVVALLPNGSVLSAHLALFILPPLR